MTLSHSSESLWHSAADLIGNLKHTRYRSCDLGTAMAVSRRAVTSQRSPEEHGGVSEKQLNERGKLNLSDVKIGSSRRDNRSRIWAVFLITASCFKATKIPSCRSTFVLLYL